MPTFQEIIEYEAAQQGCQVKDVVRQLLQRDVDGAIRDISVAANSLQRSRQIEAETAAKLAAKKARLAADGLVVTTRSRAYGLLKKDIIRDGKRISNFQDKDMVALGDGRLFKRNRETRRFEEYDRRQDGELVFCEPYAWPELLHKEVELIGICHGNSVNYRYGEEEFLTSDVDPWPARLASNRRIRQYIEAAKRSEAEAASDWFESVMETLPKPCQEVARGALKKYGWNWRIRMPEGLAVPEVSQEEKLHDLIGGLTNA
jgi:hypothetical protein